MFKLSSAAPGLGFAVSRLVAEAPHLTGRGSGSGPSAFNSDGDEGLSALVAGSRESGLQILDAHQLVCFVGVDN